MSTAAASTAELPEETRSLGPLKRTYEANPKYWMPLLIIGIVILVLGLAIGVAGALLAPAEHRMSAIGIGSVFALGSVALIVAALAHRKLRIHLCEGGFAREFAGKTRAYSWENVKSTRVFEIPSAQGNKHFLKMKDGQGLVLSTEVLDVDELAITIESKVTAQLRPEIQSALAAGESVEFNALRVSQNGLGYKPPLGGWKTVPWNEIRGMDIRLAANSPAKLLVLSGSDGKALATGNIGLTPNVRLLIEQIKAHANLG
jgi:hypothetical protein